MVATGCRRGGRPRCASRRSALSQAVPGGVLTLLDTVLDVQPAWLAGCLYTRVPALTPRGRFVLLIPNLVLRADVPGSLYPEVEIEVVVLQEPL